MSLWYDGGDSPSIAHALRNARVIRHGLRNVARSGPSENGRDRGSEVEVGGLRRVRDGERHQVVDALDVRLERRGREQEVDLPRVLRMTKQRFDLSVKAQSGPRSVTCFNVRAEPW